MGCSELFERRAPLPSNEAFRILGTPAGNADAPKNRFRRLFRCFVVCANSLPPVVSEEVIGNHQKSFHYAVLLYFNRVFHGAYCANPKQFRSSTAQAHAWAEEDCQGYVGVVLDCLENIDCITRDTHIRPANTLWPAFIAAVEAVNVDLRHRALIWLSKASQRGLGNVSRAKEVVMETWRRVDRIWDSDAERPLVRQGLGPVDWREIMQQKGSYIMLT